METASFRIGAARFDVPTARLYCGGRPADLDRASLAVLQALLAAEGKEVDKDQLLEAGWPGRIVHENSLAKAISRLRTALGDDGAALETVHGYGYRLIAEKVAGEPAPERARWRLPHRPLWLGGAALSVVATGWLVSAGVNDQRLIKGEAADAVGRVLWVDDHPQNNNAEKQFLEARKIAVYQVRRSEDALRLLSMYEYGAVISDMNRHGKPLEGLALVEEMRRRSDRTPYIIYSVVPSEAQRALVAEAGGQAAVTKSAELYDAVLPLFPRARSPAPQTTARRTTARD